MGQTVITPKFRVSYPSVFKPKKNDLNGKTEFSLVALFPQGANLEVLKQAAHTACVEKWGPDSKKWPPNLKNPIRDQGERVKNVDGKEILPNGYEAGAKFLTLKSEQKPGVVDENVQAILDESLFYAGCWARASVRAYAYDNKGNRGVAFGLSNVQKVAEGDPLGSRTLAAQDFQPIEGANGGAVAGATAGGMFD